MQTYLPTAKVINFWHLLGISFTRLDLHTPLNVFHTWNIEKMLLLIGR